MRVSRSLVAVAVLVAERHPRTRRADDSCRQAPLPSPQGQSAVQLGGRWDKTADGPRYVDGKWVVVDYGRPLLRGRTNIFGATAEDRQGGQRWLARLADGRQRLDATDHAGVALDWRQDAETWRLQRVRRAQARRLDAGAEHAAAPAQIRHEREGAALRGRTTTTRSSTCCARR